MGRGGNPDGGDEMMRGVYGGKGSRFRGGFVVEHFVVLCKHLRYRSELTSDIMLSLACSTSNICSIVSFAVFSSGWVVDANPLRSVYLSVVLSIKYFVDWLSIRLLLHNFISLYSCMGSEKGSEK